MNEREIRFKAVLLKIGALYNNSMNELLIEIWFEDLIDQDIDDIEIAFASYRKGDKRSFMPKPGDFLEIINGKPKDNAILQWANVVHAAKSASDGMNFRDPITHRVVQDMGGRQLGFVPEADWLKGHLRQAFIDNYIARQNEIEIKKALEKKQTENNLRLGNK